MADFARSSFAEFREGEMYESCAWEKLADRFERLDFAVLLRPGATSDRSSLSTPVVRTDLIAERPPYALGCFK